VIAYDHALGRARSTGRSWLSAQARSQTATSTLVVLALVLSLALATSGAGATVKAGPQLIVRAWSQKLPFLAGLAFLPDGRALVTEKDTGVIRLIEQDGKVRRKPFARLRVSSGAEYGLLSIAVDPSFRRYPFVYVYYVQPTPDGKEARRARLVRFRFRKGIGVSPRVIVDNLKTNTETIHVGGAMAFQGDYLLLAVGDGSPARADPRAKWAQDLSNRQGKILRLTREGRPAPRNPYRNGIFTLGHRNSYGLTVDRRTGAIFETENGPDQSDEVNRLVAGRNYGWPVCEGIRSDCHVSRYSNPLWETGLRTLALTGVVSYHGKRVPALRDTVTVCGFKDGALYSFRLSARQQAIASVVRHSAPGWRCGAALVEAPDGAIAFTDTRSGRVVRIVGSS
jgi:glucose/arabinose dehydrogenase